MFVLVVYFVMNRISRLHQLSVVTVELLNSSLKGSVCVLIANWQRMLTVVSQF